MGKVYLAEHILLGQQRALKFISGELGQDAHFLKRFRHEAQAAIKLRHPNIVEVVDLDQAEDGSPYIAMEYVEGPDLRCALATGAFSVERALNVVRGIAQGLGAAHAKGIVHRDVKPENILLAGGNGTPETPKLLDFGIAAIQEGATSVSRTRGLMLLPSNGEARLPTSSTAAPTSTPSAESSTKCLPAKLRSTPTAAKAGCNNTCMRSHNRPALFVPRWATGGAWMRLC
jgi:serine/threonine protein kinase